MRTSSVAGLGFCAGSSAENACWGRRDAPTSTVVWRVFFNFIMYLNTRTVLRKSNVFLPQGDNAPVLATRCIIIRILLALPCTQNRTLTYTFRVHFLGYRSWLGRRDSNPRMPGPKPGALPLGYAPTKYSKAILASSSSLGTMKIFSCNKTQRRQRPSLCLCRGETTSFWLHPFPGAHMFASLYFL